MYINMECDCPLDKCICEWYCMDTKYLLSADAFCPFEHSTYLLEGEIEIIPEILSCMKEIGEYKIYKINNHSFNHIFSFCEMYPKPWVCIDQKYVSIVINSIILPKKYTGKGLVSAIEPSHYRHAWSIF